MKLFKIEDIKGFMEILFLKEIFDGFCLGSMEIRTMVSISVRGNLIPDWFDSEQREVYKQTEYVPWKLFRPTAFAMIRGKQPPKTMRIYFLHQRQNGDCGGLRVQYENDSLVCMSSYTPAHFTMDKSGEQMWDEKCVEFFRKNGVVSTLVE